MHEFTTYRSSDMYTHFEVYRERDFQVYDAACHGPASKLAIRLKEADSTLTLDDLKEIIKLLEEKNK